MSDLDAFEEKEAKHGQKMIEIKVRFWTNNIAEDKDHVVPKRAWTSGVVRLTPNDTHGIDKSQKAIPFNSLMQIPSVIEEVLLRESIILHPGRMGNYIKPKGE